jgi:hypothetical protein
LKDEGNKEQESTQKNGVKEIKQTSQKYVNREETQKGTNMTFKQGKSRKGDRYKQMKLLNGPA